jgi:parallel beta-helix repeat protein
MNTVLHSAKHVNASGSPPGQAGVTTDVMSCAPAIALLALLLGGWTAAAGAEDTGSGGAHLVQVHASPQGDDAATGTVGAPVRTLRRALALVPAGGRISLTAGVWREGGVLIERGGSADRPLVIEGAGMGATIITGAVPVSGWRRVAGEVWRVDGWSVNSQQLSADGVPLAQIGARSPWHTKVLWEGKVCLPTRGDDVDDLERGTFYHDGEAQALSCRLADGSDPNARLMEASVADGLIDGGSSSHVVLRGLTLRRGNGTARGDKAALLRLGAAHWTVEACEIADGDFSGIAITGEDHAVRGSRIVGNGNTGIDINGSDAAHGYRWWPDRPPMRIVIEDCAIVGNNARRFAIDWHAGGMKCIPACRAVTVRGCEVRDNHGAGIWFDHALGDIRIEDNLVVGNRTGIFYEISAPGPGDGFGALIRNNRVVGNDRQGVYVSASCGARVEGNTLSGNWVNLALHGMPRGEHRLVGNSATDNIFAAAGLADVIWFVGKDAADNRLDGNLYAVFPGRADDRPRIGVVRGGGYDITHRDLGRLAEDAGLEQAGRRGDPRWRKPEALDFTPIGPGPAQGKGWRPPTRPAE